MIHLLTRTPWNDYTVPKHSYHIYYVEVSIKAMPNNRRKTQCSMAMLVKSYKDRTFAGGCCCLGSMVVRMRKEMATHSMGLVFIVCVYLVLSPFSFMSRNTNMAEKITNQQQVSTLFTCRRIVASLGKNNLLSFIYQLMFLLSTELLSALQ